MSLLASDDVSPELKRPEHNRATDGDHADCGCGQPAPVVPLADVVSSEDLRHDSQHREREDVEYIRLRAKGRVEDLHQADKGKTDDEANSEADRVDLEPHRAHWPTGTRAASRIRNCSLMRRFSRSPVIAESSLFSRRVL